MCLRFKAVENSEQLNYNLLYSGLSASCCGHLSFKQHCLICDNTRQDPTDKKCIYSREYLDKLTWRTESHIKLGIMKKHAYVPLHALILSATTQ